MSVVMAIHSLSVCVSMRSLLLGGPTSKGEPRQTERIAFLNELCLALTLMPLRARLRMRTCTGVRPRPCTLPIFSYLRGEGSQLGAVGAGAG